jgi:hypothetical protein
MGGGKEMNKMERIISGLKSEKNGYCRISQKRGWFGYLEDGDMVFTPQDLKKMIVRVVKENLPRGERLFDLNWCQQEKRFHFTMLGPKKPKLGPPVQPYRTEEALERFIVLSNGDRFYNQIPIGGGKESIDIGIKESHSKFIFVELKPWESHDSPLYALIESLKNLIEYWAIPKGIIPEIKRYEHIELMVLAPIAYYRTYRLLEPNGKRSESNLSVVRDTLAKIGSEFKEFNLAAISFMTLPDIGKPEFLQKCWEVYKEKFKGQTKELVQLTRAHAIPLLARNRWRLVVSTDETI